MKTGGRFSWDIWWRGIMAAAVCAILPGCGSHPAESGVRSNAAIRIRGSESMVDLLRSWGQAYAQTAPGITVEVAGGGSSEGLAALIQGAADIANSSRAVSPEELEQARATTGKIPQAFVADYAAVVVCVHSNNPLDTISLEELGEIYGEGGMLTNWSQLGIEVPGCTSQDIVRADREPGSGTRDFLREYGFPTREFQAGSTNFTESDELLRFVAATPCAIGYSGITYDTRAVKPLKIAARLGEPACAPTMNQVLRGQYPIAHLWRCYTLGEPQGEVKKFLDWCRANVLGKPAAATNAPAPPSSP